MKKFILLVICFLLCSCTKTKLVFNETVLTELSPKSSKVTLSMVGDALVHTPVYRDAYLDGRYDFSKMFYDFTSEIKNSDLLYYNQESIIGGDNIPYTGYPRFNTPSSFGETMINMGFNIVSRANNHTLDKGEIGVINSCNFWNKFPNILTNGSSCTSDERLNPQIMEINGITYTMLSYTMHTNGLRTNNSYYVNVYSDEIVKQDIENIRDSVDLLLVSMHWGDEYKSIPNSEQIRISEYLASLGADIIIGTHPHVIEPIRWIDDTLVIYSLGNFISSQKPVDNLNRLIGLLVNVDIIKTTSSGKSNIILDNLNTTLLYTYYKNYHNYKVIPFNKLNDSILKDYKNYKNRYDSIVKYYDQGIKTN